MGADLIEVSDNGIGINPENYESIALKHHTSKLATFQDLESVRSFGFRGEALNALCEISGDFRVHTKQGNQRSGLQLGFSRDGRLLSQVPVVRSTGTTVYVSNLFAALPVRRSEFLRNIKRQYQRMVKILQSYAVIAVGVQITVTNIAKSGGRQVVISTQSSRRIEDNISAVFGSKFLSSLMPIALEVDLAEEPTESDDLNVGSEVTRLLPVSTVAYTESSELEKESHTSTPVTIGGSNNRSMCRDSSELDIQGILSALAADPGSGSDLKNMVGLSDAAASHSPSSVVQAENGILSTASPVCDSLGISAIVRVSGFVSRVGLGVGRSDNERQFVFLNQRPIDCSRVTKVINEVWRRYDMQQKPAFIISLSVPAGYFDINVTPDKREVVLVKQECILAGLRMELERLYAPSRYSFPLALGTAATCATRDLLAYCTPSSTGTPSQSFPVAANSHLQEYCIKSDNNFSQESAAGDLSNNHDQDSVTVGLSPEDVEEADGEQPVRPISVIRWTSPRPDIGQYSYSDERGGADYGASRDPPGAGTAGASLQSFPRKRPRSESDIGSGAADGVSCQTIGGYSTEDISRERHSNQSGGGLSSNTAPISRPVDIARGSDAVINWDVDEALQRLLSASQTAVSNRVHSRRKYIRFREKFSRIYETTRSAPIAAEFVKDSVPSVTGSLDAPAADAEEVLAARVLDRNDFAKMRVVGQFNLGFIVVRLRGDLFVLDQHACDEKFRFEALQQSTTIHQQPLLSPMVVECSAAEEMVIEDNLDGFEANGFRLRVDEAAAVGARIRLLAVPFSKGVQFGCADVLELASMLASGECDNRVMLVNDGNAMGLTASTGSTLGPGCRRLPRLPKLVAMFASRACRSAVMIGTGLGATQMQRLVAQMSVVEQPWNCPHGRPTMRHVVDLKALSSRGAGV